MSKNETSNYSASLRGFSHDELTVIDNAVKAWGAIKKTFTTWMTIAEGVAMIRQRADEIGGGKTFRRKLDEAGLDDLPPATCTRLIAIYEHKQAVTKWHDELPGDSVGKKLRWASPSAVYKHCPVFQKGTPKPRPQPAIADPKKVAKVMEHQEARIDEMHEEIESLKAQNADLKTSGTQKGTTPTFDQAVEIVIATVAAMPKAKLLSTWKEITRRLGEATAPAAESKRVRKSKGDTASTIPFEMKLG